MKNKLLLKILLSSSCVLSLTGCEFEFSSQIESSSSHVTPSEVIPLIGDPYKVRSNDHETTLYSGDSIDEALSSMESGGRYELIIGGYEATIDGVIGNQMCTLPYLPDVTSLSILSTFPDQLAALGYGYNTNICANVQIPGSVKLKYNIVLTNISLTVDNLNLNKHSIYCLGFCSLTGNKITNGKISGHMSGEVSIDVKDTLSLSELDASSGVSLSFSGKNIEIEKLSIAEGKGITFNKDIESVSIKELTMRKMNAGTFCYISFNYVTCQSFTIDKILVSNPQEGLNDFYLTIYYSFNYASQLPFVNVKSSTDIYDLKLTYFSQNKIVDDKTGTSSFLDEYPLVPLNTPMLYWKDMSTILTIDAYLHSDSPRRTFTQRIVDDTLYYDSYYVG